MGDAPPPFPLGCAYGLPGPFPCGGASLLIVVGVALDTITYNVILATLLGAITWNLLTWWWGLPSSSSHALMGAFAGAAAYLEEFLKKDPGAIDWLGAYARRAGCPACAGAMRMPMRRYLPAVVAGSLADESTTIVPGRAALATPSRPHITSSTSRAPSRAPPSSPRTWTSPGCPSR